MTDQQDPQAPALVGRCSDAYLSALCQHTGVAVVGTDINLRVIFWNAAADRMFGAAASQMYGVPLLSVIPDASRAEAEQMLRKAVDQGEIGGFEFSAPGPGSKRRVLAANVSPVIDDRGRVVGTSAFVRDITNRIRLQEQLARNRKMGSLGAMAGAMAHYFNNILGGAITSVDFALASNDPVLQKRVLEKTAQALARAAQLGDGLLTFAEGDFRTADLADLTEVLIEITHTVEPELASAGIQLEMDLQPIPVTAVPAAQFRTAMSHLIQNAIEAMPDGGKLTVTLATCDEGYRIRVSDTGCGVSEDLQDRIFEPFYSTKASGEAGTGEPRPGLGLAVAHGPVPVMGGRIVVESEGDAGTTFEITLPRTPKLPAVKT
jgi:PAS domain S-box-containing protein